MIMSKLMNDNTLARLRSRNSIGRCVSLNEAKVLLDEIDILRAERQEGLDMLADCGPIRCRNGVVHKQIDKCLYCEIDRLQAELIELRKDRP